MDLNTTEHQRLSLETDMGFTLPFSQVMDQTFIEVMVNDSQGKILFVNRKFERFSGLSGDQAVGQPIRVLAPLFGQGEYYDRLCRTMETGKPWQGKERCRTLKGERRTYYTSISPISTGGEVVFLSIRRDITDLENRDRELQQTRKMEAIGALAGGIAHDFNNILAGIVGYAELVKEDLDELEGSLPETHTRLDNMISGAMRAKNLIHQILTFSRSGQEALAPVRVGGLVKEVAQLLRASLPATIRMELTLASDAVILAEPTQIHQILMNLCTNARDAMADSGGVLAISLRTLEPGKEKTGEKGWVRLRVADTGPGIDREIRHRVMDPFFTTKSPEKGTGMGLSVVHGIVSGLGGNIRIWDNSPQGAIFDIDLPLYTGEGTDARDSEEPKPWARGKGEVILFVDDETDLIRIAEDGLSRMGYRVVGFDDSQRALAWIRENTGVPDLVISDVTMPDLPGDQLVQQIRLLRPDLPALLITGASERVNESRVRQMGAQALLHKPMVFGQMALVIRQTLDRRKNGPDSNH